MNKIFIYEMFCLCEGSYYDVKNMIQNPAIARSRVAQAQANVERERNRHIRR